MGAQHGVCLRFLLVSWAVASVAGCDAPVSFTVSRPCQVTSDCPDDSGCEQGRCRACPACAPEERCLKGVCHPATCGGVLCPDGQACVDGRCTAASCVGLACAPGTRCAAGACVACAAVDACEGGADEDCDGLTGCEDPDCEGRSCGADLACAVQRCQAGGCAQVPGPAGSTCRAAAGACDLEERCDGLGTACPDDARRSALEECAPATGPCELPAFCDGASPECPAKVLLDAATVCGPAAGPCDLEERCTGADAACPADQVRGSGFECNASRGPCDPAEVCDGATTACPPDARSDSSTVCSPALHCRLEARCDGVAAICPDAALAGAGTVCRLASRGCEADATCDGAGETCPANPVLGTGVSCRPGLGPCDPAEACDGLSPDCPADARSPAEVVCDPATGPCETSARCDGASALCPAKAFLDASTVCGPSTGDCDLEERCTGSSAVCPSDQVRGPGAVCRASLGACDPEEVCDGASKACPAEVRLGPGDRCALASGDCELDAYCDGASATCPAKVLLSSTCRNAADVCDEPEVCDGVSPTCPADVLSTSSKQCNAAPLTFCDGVSTACPSGSFPAAPVFVSIAPGSPSNASTAPSVTGTASADSVTITLYSDPGCTTQIGTGTKAAWEGGGIVATVPANATTTLYAVATNALTNASPCTYMTTYVHDSLAPDAPAFVATSPSPPAGPAFAVVGTVSSDTVTVTIFTDATCATAVGTGSGALFEGAGVAVTLPANVDATLYGQAADAAGNASACVVLTSYLPVRAWTWVAGPSTASTTGVAGALGVADPTYHPGSRHKHVLWARSGEIWLFGGVGCNVGKCPVNNLNDLWRFDGASWAWMKGTATDGDELGTYGTQGVAAAANTPGSRISAATATDAAGNLWLFGGWGFGASGSKNSNGELNDLWKFDGTDWTWVSGGSCSSATCTPLGVYGSRGVAAASNVPGGRDSGIAWVDAAGRFWLFGGTGCDEASCVTNTNALSDVWMFEPASGLWTWVAGPKAANTPASYGTLGTAAAGNLPGARYLTAGWYGASSGLRIFGGWGFDSVGTKSDLGDLWRLDGETFTWVGGSSLADQTAVPGTRGVPAATNRPGARDSMGFGGDALGNAFLYGGNGCDAATCNSSLSYYLSDLWSWNGTSWTWLTGSSAANEVPVYGSQGVADPANTPGGRARAAGVVDSAGAFWLFGGEGRDASSSTGKLCDLWRYQ